MVWFYSLLSVLLVSLVSLVGAITLYFKEKTLNNVLIYLVSLSAGTLLGASFFHLIPEAMSEKNANALLFVLFGFLVFFVLEKVIRWRHCHETECDEHSKSFSYMILVGDTVHNFIDGALIAAVFMVDASLGLATVFAVVMHEIPQEIGDFGTLIYSGMSKAKALIFNFASSLAAFLGAILILSSKNGLVDFVYNLIPIAAGGFIYIAAVDLFPEMHKKNKFSQSFGQLLFVLTGIGIMWAMSFFE